MKVTVVFQKDDIQQLVLKELNAKGLKPAPGSDVKIKGMPKEVIVVVDVSEFPDTTETPEPATTKPTPPPGPVKRELSPAEDALENTPMEEILGEANKIKATPPKSGAPQKGGRVQIFTDFPDEDRVK